MPLRCLSTSSIYATRYLRCLDWSAQTSTAKPPRDASEYQRWCTKKDYDRIRSDFGLGRSTGRNAFMGRRKTAAEMVGTALAEQWDHSLSP